MTLKIGILHTAFLGDLALAGKLIQGLFSEGHKVVLFSNKLGCQLYLYDKRLLERVVVDKKRSSKLKSINFIAKQINHQKLDVLLVPHQSTTSAIIAWLSGTPTVVGFSSLPAKLLFHKNIPYLTQEHESNRLLFLGKDFISAQQFKTLWTMPRNYLESSSEPKMLNEAHPQLNKQKYFVCTPGSVWNTKKLPSSILAEFIYQVLKKKKDIFCVLTGGPADIPDVKSVYDQVETICKTNEVDSQILSRMVDASCHVPACDLVTVIARSIFVVSPDSAPLHVAGGAAVPVLGIYGPTPWDKGFGPLGSDSVVVAHRLLYPHVSLPCHPCSSHGHKACPKGHHKCMAQLQAQDIFASVRDLIDRIVE